MEFRRQPCKDHLHDNRSSSLSTTTANRHRRLTDRAPTTNGEKGKLYITWPSSLNNLNPYTSIPDLSRSSSTIKACLPSLIIALVLSIGGSLSTSSAPLTIPSHCLRCQVAPELCARWCPSPRRRPLHRLLLLRLSNRRGRYLPGCSIMPSVTQGSSLPVSELPQLS